MTAATSLLICFKRSAYVAPLSYPENFMKSQSEADGLLELHCLDESITKEATHRVRLSLSLEWNSRGKKCSITFRTASGPLALDELEEVSKTNPDWNSQCS